MSTSVTSSKPFPYLHSETLQHSRRAGSSRKNNVAESIIEAPALMRKNRKRSCSCLRAPKNVEELERQRLVHITVERNRRKQMNEHLALLRTLMPTSYVQRGDQASIVGATIEFVKELEQILHSLKVEKQRREECMSLCIQQEDHYILLTNLDEGRSNPCKGFQTTTTAISSPAPTSSSSSSSSSSIYSSNNEIISSGTSNNNVKCSCEGGSCVFRSGLHGHAKYDNSPDCEVQVKVKVVGVDVLLVNVMSPEKMGGKLLRIMSTLQFGLKLTIRHLNVTTIDHSVLYSFHVQIGAQKQMAQCARQIEIYLQQIVTTVKVNYALPLQSPY